MSAYSMFDCRWTLRRECSIEKCWGGGGHPKSVLALGGGGACEFRMCGKESTTLHFPIVIKFK